MFALVALLAWKAPHRIRPIAFTVVSAVGVIVGSVLWIGGMSTHEAWLIVLGVCLYWWFRYSGLFYGALLFVASCMAGPTWPVLIKFWHYYAG